MKALELDHVSYRYPSEDFDIIDDLSFSVERGSFHCIVGVSGCGKSTIFRLTNGLLKPKSGVIRVEGKPIVGQKHYCGYMPQKDLLFPWRTIGENLALPLEIMGGYSKAQRRELVDAALADTGLTGSRDKRPEELSGGMRQRAAFARTMLTGSDLLLLDEPFSALDSHLRFRLEQEVREIIRDFGKTVMLVSHDRDEVFRLSDRIAVISDGKVETFGSKAAVFAQPQTKNAAILTGCKNISPIERLGPRRVRAVDWGMELDTASDVGDALSAGIRMHDVRPGPGENSFLCDVTSVIENPFSFTVMLRPVGSEGAVPLGWEMEKAQWNALRAERLEIHLPSEAIVLLRG